jgi:glutathione-specific gamma-glutamylcyclotransferase
VVTLISQHYYALLEDPNPEPTPEWLEDLTGLEGAASSQGGRVWGAAYHIPKEYAREVLEYLDVREQNGYSMERGIFFPIPENQHKRLPLSDIVGSSRRAEAHHLSNASTPNKQPHEPFTCLVYIGLPSNPQFLGPQDPERLAQRILQSRGPSGENREYLYELHEALAQLSPGLGFVDGHVADLVSRCKRLETKGTIKS